MISIVFCADLPDYDHNYWEAKIEITYEFFDAEKLLFFKITDYKQQKIQNGTLLFAQFELPIKNGIAKISRKDFQRSMKKHKIKYKNVQDIIIPGHLKLND